MRKIIHCDCDSFYASVEIRDNPQLKDLPVAVGGRANQRGVVATCNYNARAYGIHSAMPMISALRLCPDLQVLPVDMPKYKAESAKVQAIFRAFTPIVEPLSLDEAYLDVSDCRIANGSATRIAKEIRTRVEDEVGITISAGIAPNKFLAKIASDWLKPNGQFTITPEQVDSFVYTLPVKKLLGVGSVTAKRMQNLGIHTCGDLQTVPLNDLTRHFGKFGTRLYQLSRGEDNRAVSPKRQRKSLSAEHTYAQDLPSLAACQQALETLFKELDHRIEQTNCRHLICQRTIKLRFNGFITTTASSTGGSSDLTEYARLLDQAWHRHELPVRLIGAGVKLSPSAKAKQLGLF